MKAYRICCIDNVGFQENFEYRRTRSSAMQCFNCRIEEEVKEAGENIVCVKDFNKAVENFKEFPATNKIIAIREPVIIFADKHGLKANVYQYFEGSNKEYKDVIAITVDMQEIEIFD